MNIFDNLIHKIIIGKRERERERQRDRENASLLKT